MTVGVIKSLPCKNCLVCSIELVIALAVSYVIWCGNSKYFKNRGGKMSQRYVKEMKKHTNRTY